PFFSGFFSKDEILAQAFVTGNYLLWVLGLVTAVLTAFYIFRGIFLTFFGESRDHSLRGHESPGVMTLPLIVLAVLAIVGGYVGLPGVIGANAMGTFLAPVFNDHTAETVPALEW